MLNWSRIVWAIVGIILLIPAISITKSLMHARNRELTRSRFKQISAALQSYHEVYRSFPPALVRGPDGKSWHSWRVLLLPYLDESDLAARYRFDEPWNGPHNRELIALCPKVYQSPAWETKAGKTNVYGLVSRRTAWPAYHSISIDRALDGPYNTMHTVEGPPVSDWSEPRELSVREWTDLLRGRDQGVFAGFMDGAVRVISKNIDQTVLASIMTPRYGQLMYSGPDWPDELIETSTLGAETKVKTAADLQWTSMRASAFEPLDRARNQLWCATFQMAWDELKQKTGGDVRAGANPTIVQQLNAHPFPRKSLDSSTYLVAATDSGERETRALSDQIQTRFPGMQPQLETLPDDGLPDTRLFACLVKRMPFVEQLDRFPKPLEYRGARRTRLVRSFGRQPSTANGLGPVVLAGQIVVGDYVSDQEFVLILNTNSPQKDEIILGKVAPGQTLRDTWEVLNGRLKSPHPNRVHKDLHDGDRLEIPILEFGLSQNFSEIEGLTIDNLPGENRLRTARQIIRFRLDETGAEIIAEAESMVVGENGFDPVPYDPTKPRRFVFDQPFFVALRESGKDEPYFLAWNADPELMVAE